MHMLPSPWVIRFLDVIAPSGRVLDLACGQGRHLALGLGSGRRMVGVDRDIAAARQLGAEADLNQPRLELHEIDLEDGRPFPFAPGSFDGVIVTNYLWRPILPALVAAVAPAGMLIYETFGQGNEAFGRPRNPDFLLRPGELLETVAGKLQVLAYEHLRLEAPTRIVQRIAAVGPAYASRPPAVNLALGGI